MSEFINILITNINMVMNKKLQITKLKVLTTQANRDKFDWIAEIDGRLTYEENKTRVMAKLQRRGLLKSNYKSKNVRSANLMDKAQKLNNKRKKSSRVADGVRKAKKTFKARELTKKQFLLWKKGKDKYDIEGIDSQGTYIKKTNISKKQARKYFDDIDLGDLN